MPVAQVAHEVESSVPVHVAESLSHEAQVRSVVAALGVLEIAPQSAQVVDATVVVVVVYVTGSHALEKVESAMAEEARTPVKKIVLMAILSKLKE